MLCFGAHDNGRVPCERPQDGPNGPDHFGLRGRPDVPEAEPAVQVPVEPHPVGHVVELDPRGPVVAPRVSTGEGHQEPPRPAATERGGDLQPGDVQDRVVHGTPDLAPDHPVAAKGEADGVGHAGVAQGVPPGSSGDGLGLGLERETRRDHPVFRIAPVRFPTIGGGGGEGESRARANGDRGSPRCSLRVPFF